MGLQDIAFMPASAIYTPYLLQILEVAIASGQPHVLNLATGVSDMAHSQ